MRLPAKRTGNRREDIEWNVMVDCLKALQPIPTPGMRIKQTTQGVASRPVTATGTVSTTPTTPQAVLIRWRGTYNTIISQNDPYAIGDVVNAFISEDGHLSRDWVKDPVSKTERDDLALGDCIQGDSLNGVGQPGFNENAWVNCGTFILVEGDGETHPLNEDEEGTKRWVQLAIPATRFPNGVDVFPDSYGPPSGQGNRSFVGQGFVGAERIVRAGWANDDGIGQAYAYADLLPTQFRATKSGAEVAKFGDGMNLKLVGSDGKSITCTEAQVPANAVFELRFVLNDPDDVLSSIGRFVLCSKEYNSDSGQWIG